ncbi:hypothetical protein [Microbacterium sp. T2.11-28]|uniref:hypothetical protein n=1 Tax=Microbacterium sp. T2.11-28 TaxID=3041169 RepID=UPI002477C7DE|nr:hypothetical protein [Microbacterium sp. T2.11-28]CAI9386070.1 hypothetical protein MICABA_00156 [Microbacterium sp. T2.11-28]
MSESTAQTTGIHPEIPLAPWVTTRYEDDDGRLVVDENKYHYTDVDVWVDRGVTHALNEDGSFHSSTESALISYDLVWPEGGRDAEQFTVLASSIPILIAALLRLEKEMAE